MGEPERYTLIERLGSEREAATVWRARADAPQGDVWLTTEPSSAHRDRSRTDADGWAESGDRFVVNRGRSLRDEMGPHRRPVPDRLAVCNQLVKLMAAAHETGRHHGGLAADRIYRWTNPSVSSQDRLLVPAAVQEDRSASARDDVQALGEVMYEVLSGHRTRTDQSDANRLHHRSSTPWPVADVVHQCLDGDHFANAAEVEKAFSAALPGVEGSRRRRAATTPVAADPGGGAFGGALRNRSLGQATGARRIAGIAALVVAAFAIPVIVVLVLAGLLGGPDDAAIENTVAGARTVNPAVGSAGATAVASPAPTLPPTTTPKPSPTSLPTPKPTVAARPLLITGVVPWDPGGSFAENDLAAPAAIDGDDTTAWTTEIYRGAGFGGLKDGVGLWVILDEPALVDSVTITSTTADWPGEIHRFAPGPVGPTDIAVDGSAAPASETIIGEPPGVDLVTVEDQLVALSQTARFDFGPASASFRFSPPEDRQLAADGTFQPETHIIALRDPDQQSVDRLLIWIQDLGLFAGAYGTSIEEVTVTGRAPSR